MRALVTGSSGFVGRHMVKALRKGGCDVDCVDLSDGDHSLDCREWFADNYDRHYDLVVHCAAVVGGRATIDGEPLRLACEDLSIDAALFSWAMRARPGRIVYFSSAAAYPVTRQTKDYADFVGGNQQLRESLIDDEQLGGVGTPDQTYGWVKLTGERLAREANAIGIPTHVFRPFSGYGADQDQAYPFPAIVARALRRESYFKIWGDPRSSRDWVHIDDVVGAVLAAIEADYFEPVNICTGVETTFGELAKMVMMAVGHWCAVECDLTAPQGVFRRVGDPNRLHEFYTPKVSIEEGVLRAVEEWRGEPV